MKKINILTFALSIISLGICILLLTSRNSRIDIWAEKSNSVFEVVLYQDGNLYGNATCFAFDRNGLVLTNKHVVNKPNTSIFVKICDSLYEATIEMISVEYDIAIMSVDYEFNDILKVVDYRASVGDVAYTIGNPNGIGLILQEGIVSGVKKIIVIDGNEYLVIQVSMSLNEGNSGGPIFDEKGNVIGIVSFRMKNSDNEIIDSITFCYSSDEILDVIESYGIE